MFPEVQAHAVGLMVGEWWNQNTPKAQAYGLHTWVMLSSPIKQKLLKNSQDNFKFQDPNERKYGINWVTNRILEMHTVFKHSYSVVITLISRMVILQNFSRKLDIIKLLC